jgi:hypothetical protein
MITDLTFSQNEHCPDLPILFANSGVPPNTYQGHGMFPLVLQNTAIWFWFAFYVLLEWGTRKAVKWNYSVPMVAPEVVVVEEVELEKERAAKNKTTKATQATKATNKKRGIIGELKFKAGAFLGIGEGGEAAEEVKEFSHRHEEVLARFPPSWIHAVLSVTFGTLALLQANDKIDAPYFTFYMVMMHSFGYFMADVLIDRDSLFFVHHAVPIIFAELMLRYNGSFYHAVWFGIICELGNVVAHGCAICFLKAEFFYVKVFKIAYGITRPLSVVFAVLIFTCDIPLQFRWTVGLSTLVLIFGIYHSNVMALLAVVKSNMITVGAAAGAGKYALGALFAARYDANGVSVAGEAAIVGPRSKEPVFAPYRPSGYKPAAVVVV